MLEYALKIDLDLNENKTFNDIYNSATDCIQYCKANDEQVIRLYLQNHMFSHLLYLNHMIFVDILFITIFSSQFYGKIIKMEQNALVDLGILQK